MCLRCRRWIRPLIKDCNSFWKLTFGQIRNLVMTLGNGILNFLTLDVLCWFFFINSSLYHRSTLSRVPIPRLHCRIQLIQEALLRVYYVVYVRSYLNTKGSYFWYRAIGRYSRYRKSGHIVQVLMGFIERRGKWSISTVQNWSFLALINCKIIFWKWFNSYLNLYSFIIILFFFVFVI